MARHEELAVTELVLASTDGAYQFRLKVGTDGKLYIYKLEGGSETECGVFDTSE